MSKCVKVTSKTIKLTSKSKEVTSKSQKLTSKSNQVTRQLKKAVHQVEITLCTAFLYFPPKRSNSPPVILPSPGEPPPGV